MMLKTLLLDQCVKVYIKKLDHRLLQQVSAEDDQPSETGVVTRDLTTTVYPASH